MQLAIGKSWKKAVSVVASAALAAACTFVIAPPPAYASGVAWNDSVTVVANANDYDASATSTDYNQTIDVTMTFANTLDSNINATVAEAYLQTHTSIAGHKIDGTSTGWTTYVRDIDNVTVNNSAKTINFTIGRNTGGGLTANYNSELLITADSTDETGNSDFAAAMGNASVETLITSGLAIEKTGSSSGSSTFHITGLPACRQMNFVLFGLADEFDGTVTNIVSNGTCADGAGVTIHSHNFYESTADAASYVTKLVTAYNAATSSYSITNAGNGYFTITGTGAENVIVNVYNGNYLNSGHLSVGATSETIITDPSDPRA